MEFDGKPYVYAAMEGGLVGDSVIQFNGKPLEDLPRNDLKAFYSLTILAVDTSRQILKVMRTVGLSRPIGDLIHEVYRLQKGA